MPLDGPTEVTTGALDDAASDEAALLAAAPLPLEAVPAEDPEPEEHPKVLPAISVATRMELMSAYDLFIAEPPNLFSKAK